MVTALLHVPMRATSQRASIRRNNATFDGVDHSMASPSTADGRARWGQLRSATGREVGALDAAKNAERDCGADALFGQQLVQVVEAGHGSASSATMMSPSRRPAARAGPSLSTEITSTPDAWARLMEARAPGAAAARPDRRRRDSRVARGRRVSAPAGWRAPC